MSFTAKLLNENPVHSYIQIRDDTGALCGEITVRAEDTEAFLKHFIPQPDPEWAAALELTFSVLEFAVGEKYTAAGKEDMKQFIDKVRTGEWWE